MSAQYDKAEIFCLAWMEDELVLSSYPIDMSSFLTLSNCSFDAAGVPYHSRGAIYHPTTIAQYALAHWNQYLTTNDEYHRKVFFAQASWLVHNERRISAGAGGWPITSPHPDYYTCGSWLSASAQGFGLSVILRAYELTREKLFLEVARRAVHTFDLDILDGGVRAPVGADGVFFEEVASYPAAHILSGFIFALFGLYDYVALTGDTQIEQLISLSLKTMHNLLEEFDMGFWVLSGLLHRRLASSAEFALQAELLETLARYSGCGHCSALALRWKKNRQRFASLLRYFIASRCASYSHTFLSRFRDVLFRKSPISDVLHVCVPITGFPFTGGTRTFLGKVARVTEGSWELEYLAQVAGSQHNEFVIHRFGAKITSPWHFPTVWLYIWAGFWKLFSLVRRGADYHVILPQDGIFTSTFAALMAKLAGIRCVCIDHGTLTLPKSQVYRTQRLQTLTLESWPYGFLSSNLDRCYWPSLELLARCAVHFVDHFVIPGVPGDSVEEACKRLGVPQSRVTRIASMIDVDRYFVLDASSKAKAREEKGLAADAIVIAMVCRLVPEKGLDVAIEAVNQALSTLSPELRTRVRVIIAGDGPLRKYLEEDTQRRGLNQSFSFWGETSAEDIIGLLSLSDIFLYTSTRGECLSMALLEAMASGCAVIASPLPLANVQMLAEGRGIIVSVRDAEQTGTALVKLLNDPDLCRNMGNLARSYVTAHHNATIFKRTLTRVTYWSALDTFLQAEVRSEG